MEKKGLIKYIIIITIILLVAFLSQQAYFRGIEKTFISDATNKISACLADGSNWLTSKIYPKVSGEVQKRGDMIKTEVNQEKNKISENILDKTKNYFSGVANSIMHPGTPQNCQPAQTSTNK